MHLLWCAAGVDHHFEINMSRLLLNFLLVTLIWAIWFGVLGAEQAHSIISRHFEISLTMLFGSFVAGSTSVGGGAVAFPVFTKLLQIPSDITLVFSLAIQSIGMGVASFLIVSTRTPIVLKIILHSFLFGAIGMGIGLFLLGPVLPSADVRYVFSMFSVIVGVALVVNHRRVKQGIVSELQDDAQEISARVLFPIALIGGILSGLIGTGIDFVIFAIMIFLGNYGIRTAIATSVVVMALNAMIGFLLVALFTDRFSGVVVEYWLAAIPIVIVGAPLGAIACRYLPRGFMFYFLMLLITVDVISTLVILGFRVPYLAMLALVLLAMIIASRRQSV